MATPPFSAEFVAKLKRATAWRFHAQLGPVFTPRFFCCSSPNEMSVVDGKQPVAVLALTPNPCLVGDTVAFDGTDSYDPDGAITDYAWIFPGGAPASSALSNGNVSWAAAGEYEVTLIVTDGTGLDSSPARMVMVVREPGDRFYLATANGVWYTADGITWAARSTGLAGAALQVNNLKIDPATQNLAEADKAVWIATDGGIYTSKAGANWIQKNPASVSNTWSDSPAPTVADLKFQKLLFVGERLFAIATWQNAAGLERSWLFYTDDAADARGDIDSNVIWFEVNLFSGGS